MTVLEFLKSIVGRSHGEVAEEALDLSADELADAAELLDTMRRLEVTRYVAQDVPLEEARALGTLAVLIAGAALKQAVDDGRIARQG